MNKVLIIFYITVVVLLSSCGTSKVASRNAATKQQLETQYQQYKGIKYRYGGNDKRGFDCSGFVQTVYGNAFKVQLPRTTKAIAQLGTKVSKGRLRPGDLVFFRPSRRYRHVGIYIDHNTFIHSSTSNGIVKSKLSNPYWKKKYRFARRILKTK